MATATFIYDGDAIDYTPSAAVTAGDIVVQNDMIGVAKTDIAASEKGALALTGVYSFPKATNVAYTVGTDLFWDEAEATVNSDSESGANLWIGKCVKAAAQSDSTVYVRLGYAPDFAVSGGHTESGA